MYTLGIDLGSTSCKAIILLDGKEIVGQFVVQSGTGTSGPQRVYKGVLENAGLSTKAIDYTVATGYGRVSFTDADKQVSELSCQAKGVRYLMPDVRTIIDIGGQDAKVLKLDSDGALSDFVMNDKCAAGTGRFLDVMAKVLEVTTADLAGLSEKSNVPVSISNTCTVFAESEVISHLSGGKDRNDIVAGIHLSIAKRVAGLVKRIGIVPEIAMTGGVAKNFGIIRAMSDVLGMEVRPAPMEQLTGALGAALLAYENVIKNHMKEKEYER